MKAVLFPLAVMASSVMAQTTTCGADYIVESCLTSETSKLNNCGTEDYDCRCAQWKNIMTYGAPLSHSLHTHLLRLR